MSQPCARQPSLGTTVGSACEHCGHNWVFHPGMLNPALTECLICAGLPEPKVLCLARPEGYFPEVPSRTDWRGEVIAPGRKSRVKATTRCVREDGHPDGGHRFRKWEGWS